MLYYTVDLEWKIKNEANIAGNRLDILVRNMVTKKTLLNKESVMLYVL